MITTTPSARSVTSIRHRDLGSAATQRRCDPGQVDSALQRGGRGSQRIADVMLADQAQLHGRRFTRGMQDEPGPAAIVGDDFAGPHVGGGGAPKVTTAACVRDRMAATAGSSELSTATPPADAGSASTSSPLAWAIASRDPNSPTCAVPTLSTTPMRGGAIWVR